MHDSSGYVYTNIIALSDAAVSMKECDSETTKKLFSFIRTQAEEGLQRTRETLHTIREITTPLSTGINDIYQLKQIFEEVTNIHIQIETGNMKQSYGSVINSSLRKIVQESLVNSLRHGKATKIFIQFWELDNLLTMIVSDNGLGAKQIVKGIGLKGMEERVSILGGTISFSSPEEGGFRLLITIPLVNDTLYEEQGSFNGRT
jgi:signal transduction histidine kinase